MSKTRPEKRSQMNQEILAIISDHSEYIYHDPMTLFYCLYFCIFYNNPEIIVILRTLIGKIEETHLPKKVYQLLGYIDINGIERLRRKGDDLSTLIFHIAMYQAFNDKLRLVYSQLIYSMKDI